MTGLAVTSMPAARPPRGERQHAQSARQIIADMPDVLARRLRRVPGLRGVVAVDLTDGDGHIAHHRRPVKSSVAGASE